MSIKSDLTVLKTNIQNAKDKLFTNLTEKGVTDITTASTLDAMADSVSGITTGGGGNSFSVIGYPSAPQYIQEPIDYAQPIYDNWDASITSCYDKFKGDKQLVYCPLVDTSNVTNMSYMFSDCTNLQYVPSLDTSNVTNMYCMFYGCSKLSSYNLTSFDTSNVIDMGNMFRGCSSLTSLDLSNWDTSNVNNMRSMFSGCTRLTSIDLSNWNTSNVTDMLQMFQNCSGLTSIDLTSFDTSKVTRITNMFYDCVKLQRIEGILDVKLITEDLGNFINSNYTNKYPLRYLTFKNLGAIGTKYKFNGSPYQNWGDESDTATYPLSVGARKSLIDSLITYSFDRAANGLSTCTIQLYSTIKARLTEDEIAAITAKGFTIA